MQKKSYKYYIQVDKTNIEKILKNETPINFKEINKQTSHYETTKKRKKPPVKRTLEQTD